MPAKKKGGKKGNRGNKDSPQRYNAPKPLTKEQKELNEWDDLENPYLTVVRKRLRNMKKKIDRVAKLREMKKSELNKDQLQSLQNIRLTEDVYLELNKIFINLKEVARDLAKPEEPEPEPEVKQPEEDTPQDPVEVVMSLSHTSKCFKAHTHMDFKSPLQ